MEGGALTGLALGEDVAVMVFDDPFAHGEADACAAVFGFAVETFEDAEDLFGMFLGKADAVVCDVDVVFGVFGTAGDGDDGRSPGAGIFEGVGDEVAEQLGHLERDGVDGGEGLQENLGLLLLDEKVEFSQDVLQDVIEVDRFEGRGGPG